MAYSRNEYLQSLNRMRANYQNQGNPLVNREDDNGNVGNELSAFAYMETSQPTTATEQASKKERNGWQRTIDTIDSAVSNVTEGVTNFLDDVWDFSVTATSWLTGLFAGIGSAIAGKGFEEGWKKGTSYVEPLVTYEWEKGYNDALNQVNRFLGGTAFLSGDVTSGKWFEDWKKVGTGEVTQELHKNSWANEWGEFGQGLQKVEQGIGYVLPSLVLAYFTGGTSLGAQIAIQGGLAFATSMGGGVEKSMKEGATYGEAIGYGATKGAISGATTAIMMGIGGSVVSKTGSGIVGKGAGKVGSAVYKATGSKGAEVFASKAVEVATRAGITYANSFANQAVEPYIQSIYDDGNAIAEAYGDNEKIKQYLARCHANATTSAVTTAIVSSAREGIDLARRGSDGYMANYYSKQAMSAQQHIAKELKSINSDLQNGKITEAQAEQRLANLDKYSATVERYGKLAVEYSEKVIEKSNENAQFSKDGQTIKNKTDYGTNEDVLKRMVSYGYSKNQTDTIRAMSKAFIHTNWSQKEVSMTNGSGNTTIVVGEGSRGEIQHTVNNQTYNVPMVIEKDGAITMSPDKANITGAIAIIKSKDFADKDIEITFKPRTVHIPTISGKEGKVTLSKDVSSKILNKANAKEITKFLDGNYKVTTKNNYVVQSKDGNSYMVIEPFKDGGQQKYGIFKIDSKTNEILDISVKSDRPSMSRAYIVPKQDEQKLIDTKLLNDDESAITYNIKGLDYDYDVSDSGEESSINARPIDRADNKAGFIYAKNPLKVEDFKKEIPFSRVSKLFGIPAELEKTYNLKLRDKTNELSALRWVAKRNGTGVQQVLEKLGYDAIVKSDKSVTFFDYSNVIQKGVQYKYGKSGQNYSDLIKRNVSEARRQELEEFVRPNGKELETQEDSWKYAELVRETLNYSVSTVEIDNYPYEVKTVSKKVYTPDMLRVVERGKRIGVETRFALKLQETNPSDRVGHISAFWTGGGKTITVFVDSGRRGTLEQTANHELAHAILDKLHGWKLLKMLDRIEFIEKTYPKEVLAKREKYCAQWDYDPQEVDYNERIYEEMFADTYAGLCEWEDKSFQKALIDDMNALYEKGSKSANNEFYKLLAKEEARDFYGDRFEMDKEPEGIQTGLAITYSDKIDLETYKEVHSKLYPMAIKMGTRISQALGITATIDKGIGGYVFDDENNKLVLSGEPSYPMTFDKNVDFEDAKLFSCLMADLSYESQNSTLVWKYAPRATAKNNEIKVYLTKIDKKLTDFVKDNYIGGFTLKPKDKSITIVTNVDEKTGLDENGKSFNELITDVENLIVKLKERGFVDGSKESNYTGTQNFNGDRPSRANVYKAWLEGKVRGKIGNSLRSLILNAQEVNNYLLSKADANGNIPDDVTRNSARILAQVHEPKKVISTVKAKSSTVLIEAGADVSKDVKYRIDSVKQAFDNALNEVVPKNGTYEISFGDVKDSFAELNLARPKDRAKVIDNLIKRLKSAEVKLVTTLGEEKYKLGDLISPTQEEQAKTIMLETLNGKAVPTKLAQWSKSLDLQKIKTHETARSFKLMNRINRKIKSGTVNYFSAPTDAPGELTLYDKIIHDVKLPFTNESLTNLTSNIALYYTENNFGKMLANFDIPFNSYIPELNEYLNSTIVKGKPLTAQQITMANDLLQFVYNDLKDLGKGVTTQARAKARDGVVLAQALAKNPKDGFLTKGINAIKTIDHSIRSPISVGTTILGEDHPFVVHLRDGGKLCENNQRAVYNSMRDQVFKDTKIKNIDKEGAKKVTFFGRKIKVAQALKIINTATTGGEDFYKRGGSWTVGGRRVDFKPTPAQIEELKSQISAEMTEWNKNNVLKFFNGESKSYVQRKFKEMNHVDLTMVDGQYYPTRAVGDKIADLKVSHSGSISPSDWGLSFLKERVSHTDAPYNLDGDVFQDTLGYIQKITQWGEWAEWYHNLKIMENSRVFGQGTSLTAVMEKSVVGWKDMMDFVHHTALGIPYDNSQNLMGKLDNAIGGVFQNFQQVAMMDLFTQLKTLGSDFTGWQFFGTKNVIKGLLNYHSHGGVFAEKKASEIIDKYSSTLKNRHHTSEAFSANIGKVKKSKMSHVITSVVRTLDWHIHCKAFYMAQVQARQEGFGDFWTDSNNEHAVRILERYSDTTQPTTSKFNVGMYRAGANGKIIKQLFGMFQSMGQNIYQGLVGVTAGWRAGVQRVKAYEQASIEHATKAEEYRVKEEEAKARMSSAGTDEEFNEARKDWEEARYHREGHEKSKATIDEQLAKEKPRFTKKAWFNKASAYLFGLLGSGMILTLIAKTKKKAYGKEEWDDWDAKELAKDTAYASFVNWIPYIGTIANAVKNDSDLTIFTVDNMNNIISAFKDVYTSIKEGNGGHITGSTLKALTTLSAFFGIPANSLWNLLNGVWYNVDHGSNIAFKNWLGMYSASYMRTQYKDAYEKGQHDKAIANLEVWTYNYSIKTSPEVLEEIYRLNTVGENGVAPSAVRTSYTNDKGEEVKFTTAQATMYRQEYSKADKQVSALLQIEDYKKQDDKTKASLIKRIYSAYRESAMARATGIAPTSKLAQLIYYSNGDVDLAKYIMSLQNLSVVKEDKNHTRKENVVSAINKLSGFNKSEKLLLAYLSGYNVSESNKKQLVRFLQSKGFKGKDAEAFLKMEVKE